MINFEMIDQLISEERKIDIYNYPRRGFVVQLFLNKDERLFEHILPYLKNEYESNHKFTIFLKNIIMDSLKQKCKHYEKKIFFYNDDSISTSYLNDYKRKMQSMKDGDIKGYMKYMYDNYSSCYTNIENSNNIIENYDLFEIFSVLYDWRMSNSITLELNDIYIQNGLDLNVVDHSFKKYGLLTIDHNFRTIDSGSLFVYDNRINCSFLLSNIEKYIAEEIFNLCSCNQIDKLSVLISGNSVFKGDQPLSPLLEELEFGKLFFEEDLFGDSATKLYSKNYNNNLWIRIKNNEVTFEELVDDFDIGSNNEIITQVVHLEIFEDNGKSFIKHLDHEFIYYSEDEYIKRLNDIDQKGEVRKRQKTFKIDEARIPLYNRGKELIVAVLFSRFNNRDLICEYFGIKRN